MKQNHFAWIASALTLAAGLLITLDIGGAVTKLAALLPSSAEHTPSYNHDIIELVGREVIWISLFGFIYAFLLGSQFFSVAFNRVNDFMSAHTGRSLTILLGAGTIVSLIIATSALKEFPNSADEYAYLFQAIDFSEARLWSTVHDHPEFFEFDHIVQKDNKWISRFPPGWPLVLSIAFILSTPPFLINIVCGILALYFFYRLIELIYDAHIALWSVLAVTASSFFLFNAASFFSHVVSMLYVVLAIYLTLLYFRDGRNWRAALAGLFVGMLAITRPYTAVLLFVVFYGWIISKYGFRSLKPLVAIAVGALPCIGLYLWYNGATTGNILLPVTVWAYPEEKLGFYGDHTFALGVKHIIKRLLMFIYWVSPHFLLLYLILILRPAKSFIRRRPEDLFFAVLVIGYILYYSYGGNQYGPRFYFEAFPFLVAFVAARAIKEAGWVRILFVTGIVYSLVRIPVIAARENRVVRERMDLYDQVTRKKIDNAVIFIASPTGVIRPMDEENLNRNDKFYQNGVLYAIDLGERNSILMKRYPDRRFFRYERSPEMVRGKLIEISQGGSEYVRR